MLKAKNHKIVILLLLLPFLIVSCDTETRFEETYYQCPMKCEQGKTYTKQGSCPVCEMSLKGLSGPIVNNRIDSEILETSIFNLTSKWKTQNDNTIQLVDLKGDILVIVMIYTSCKAACPRLVADLRNIHTDVDNNSIKYVLVSIDPETDSPKRLKEFAIENQMDTEQWTFLQGTVADVREFSNVLAVRYKKISPIDFSHSNIISVFDKDGVLFYQQEGIGIDNKVIVSKIISLTKNF